MSVALGQLRQPTPQDGLATGTLLVMAGEALAVPAGLVVTVLLTWHLPPPEYGALVLALAAVAWLEWTVVTLYSRAAYKLVAEADDWRTMAAAVVRACTVTGAVVAALLFGAAGPTATLLGVPALAPLLRVLALEIPIFVAAQAYRTILVGRGLHGSRAALAAVRWTVRALLVAGGVIAGATLEAIAGLIVAATTVELVVARWRATRGTAGGTVGGTVGGTGTPPARLDRGALRRLLVHAAPLAVGAICLRLFERIDIFALRLLGGSMESVAAYGVAQNLALVPGLFGGALTPALIAALSYRLARGDDEGARRAAASALRAGFLILPFALLGAGAASGIIDLLFGAPYAAAAPLFAVLMPATVLTLVMGIAGAVLIAVGRLGWSLALSAPLPLLALGGHLLAVPRAGAVGAALVTATVSLSGAAAACVAVRRLVDQPVPIASLGRATALGAAAGLFAFALDLRGAALLGTLALLALLLAASLAVAGELPPDQRARLTARLRRSAAVQS